MLNTIEHIRFLVTKEILNKLSPEEEALLMEETARNPLAAETREHMLQAAKDPDLVSYLNSDRPLRQSSIILSRIESRKRKSRIIYSLAAASAAAFALIFIVPKALQVNSGKPDHTLAGSKGLFMSGNTVLLQVSGGQTVALSGDTTEFSLGNTKLKAAGNTLSYSPSARRTRDYATLTVPSGKDYILKLTDGSQVHLNAASTVRFPMEFEPAKREISITGEAYIKAAASSNAPFIVHIPGQTIEVLGTEFNVNCYDSLHHKVSLVNGKVRVRRETENIELLPGQQVLISPAGMSANIFDRYETLSWLEGRYVLNNVTLQEVCTVIERLYAVSIQVDNKALLTSRFTGKIQKGQPVEQVLRGLESTSGITYSLDAEGNYHIK
jgi:ferric-dicitrate binding protein FerR (iron transport regulator)